MDQEVGKQEREREKDWPASSGHLPCPLWPLIPTHSLSALPRAELGAWPWSVTHGPYTPANLPGPTLPLPFFLVDNSLLQIQASHLPPNPAGQAQILLNPSVLCSQIHACLMAFIGVWCDASDGLFHTRDRSSTSPLCAFTSVVPSFHAVSFPQVSLWKSWPH